MEIEKCSTSALGMAAAKSWFTVTTKVNERNGYINWRSSPEIPMEPECTV